MHPNNVDIIVAVMMFMVAYAGWQRGVLGSVLTFVSSAMGVALASRIVPDVVEKTQTQGNGDYVYGVGFMLFAGGGYCVGMLAHRVLSGRVRGGVLGLVDKTAGMALHVVVSLSLIWVLLSVLVSVVPRNYAQDIQQSQVYSWGQQHAPQWWQQMPQRLQELMKKYQQEYRNGNQMKPHRMFPLPDTSTEGIPLTAAQKQVIPSVVKVIAWAPQCPQNTSGTGFYFRSHYIMTNAHVVAGSHDIHVFSGTQDSSVIPVFFDEKMDVAVLYNPEQEGIPVHFGTTAIRGSSAVVIGFPGGGDLTITSEKVGIVFDFKSPDIYGDGNVWRKVVPLEGGVRPGNSGSPIVAKDGLVKGMIFGMEKENHHIAFGINVPEISFFTHAQLPVLPISTAQCIAHLGQ